MVWYQMGSWDGSGEMRTGMTTVLGLADHRDSLQSLRETLCRAQVWVGLVQLHDREVNTDQADLERIQRIIDEIDRQRPLGNDGKHDNRHTVSCQCDRFGREDRG